MIFCRCAIFDFCFYFLNCIREADQITIDPTYTCGIIVPVVCLNVLQSWEQVNRVPFQSTSCFVKTGSQNKMSLISRQLSIDFQALVEEVQDLLLRGIPLDGIGVQGHFTGRVNPTLLSVSVQKSTKFISITSRTFLNLFMPFCCCSIALKFLVKLGYRYG